MRVISRYRRIVGDKLSTPEVAEKDFFPLLEEIAEHLLCCSTIYELSMARSGILQVEFQSLDKHWEMTFHGSREEAHAVTLLFAGYNSLLLGHIMDAGRRVEQEVGPREGIPSLQDLALDDRRLNQLSRTTFSLLYALGIPVTDELLALPPRTLIEAYGLTVLYDDLTLADALV